MVIIRISGGRRAPSKASPPIAPADFKAFQNRLSYGQFHHHPGSIDGAGALTRDLDRVFGALSAKPSIVPDRERLAQARDLRAQALSLILGEVRRMAEEG
ncbi:hypothetical protein [Mesorhizobium sp. 128a]